MRTTLTKTCSPRRDPLLLRSCSYRANDSFQRGSRAHRDSGRAVSSPRKGEHMDVETWRAHSSLIECRNFSISCPMLITAPCDAPYLRYSSPSFAARSRYCGRSRVMTSLFNASATEPSVTASAATCITRLKRALISAVASSAVTPCAFASASCCSFEPHLLVSISLFSALNFGAARSAAAACSRSSLIRRSSHLPARGRRGGVSRVPPWSRLWRFRWRFE